jgi:thiazolinyl imide reductase
LERLVRVIACGTNFGVVYLRAVGRCPDIELAGILSRGSDRSRSYARELGVPHFDGVEGIPSDVDAACISVKGSFLGGEGTTLATGLLERGLHVLQEHPLHSSEIRLGKRAAAASGRRYHVNAHFANAGPVARFIEFCAQTAKQEPPDFIMIETGLLYSALDIVGRCLGGIEPFEIDSVSQWSAGVAAGATRRIPPYAHVSCLVGGIPTAIELQGHVVPGDVDNNFPLMHRIVIVFPSGSVSLLNTQGPVYWHRPFAVPESAAHASEPSIARRLSAIAHHRHPLAVELAPATGHGWADVIDNHWPAAAARALGDLRDAAGSGADPFYQEAGYLQAISRAWLDVLRESGGPATVGAADTPQPPVDPVAFAAQS